MLETIRLDVQSRRFAVSDNLIKMETGEETGHRQINAAIPQSSFPSSRTLSLSRGEDHSSINDHSRAQSPFSRSKALPLSRGRDHSGIDVNRADQ